MSTFTLIYLALAFIAGGMCGMLALALVSILKDKDDGRTDEGQQE